MTAEQRRAGRSRSRRSARRALMRAAGQMDANLQALRPGEDWGGSGGFDGEEGLGLGDGTGVLQDLADLDAGRAALAVATAARLDDLDLDKLAASSATRPRSTPAPAGARAGAARRRLPAARVDGELQLGPRRCASSAGRCARRRQADVRPAGPARDTASCRRGRRAVRRDPALGVRRHRAVGRPADDHQRGRAPGLGEQRGRPAPSGPRLQIEDVEVSGDRGPHPGRGRAAGGHVVLDGDGRAGCR